LEGEGARCLHQEVKENPGAAKESADVFERIQRVENLPKPIIAEGSIRAMIDVE
jgi:hypothetical protein